jgi:hypothetical protein
VFSLVDAPDQAGIDAVRKQSGLHLRQQPVALRILRRIVAEFEGVLLLRLLQGQDVQVIKQRRQLVVAPAVPIRRDLLLPGPPGMPLVAVNLVDRGTHVADSVVGHRDLVVTDGVEQQGLVTTTHIGQRELRALRELAQQRSRPG